MYIPAWPSLNPAYFIKPEEDSDLPFPLNGIDNKYFYVARNGIYHLFRALGFDKGHTVLVPDYHHGNEIYAMRAAGARLRYYPVRKNLDLDLNVVSEFCKEKPRALYVTHFVGWPQPMRELQSLCREKGILLIEDCALSFLSDAAGQPLGTFGDYSVFCLYKTLPLPNGGVLVRNNQASDQLADLNLSTCSTASVAARSLELMLQWLRMRYESAGRVLFTVKRAVGQVLKTAQVERSPVGNTGFDVSAVNLAMSPLCHLLLRRFDYGAIKETRRRNFRLLEERLRGRAALLPRTLDDGVCPLFFPLLVSDKENAARALWSRGIETVEFWNHGDPEARREGNSAQFLRKHVLEVPIHQDVTSAQLEYMATEIGRLPWTIQ
ncbi:MAG: aminotransferase class V-fold PLP-dependent enzyme [Acidobacteria bacterium]|nr:aminotransferase class V-fold PLP-dependent enzyme [Acidobacteriota bacterium]